MRRIALIACLTLMACQAADLTLPPPPKAPEQPGPGTVYGRVVYARPGDTTRQAASGASISILGTSLGAIAGEDGNFLLAGITQSSGTLLIRFDSDKDGRVDRQRSIELADINAGLGRQIALGEIAVVENARLKGRVLLGDREETPSGHGNTTVFVPAGPFTTYTNDDGSFSLSELPEGTLQIQIFHSGYEAATVDGIKLRAGEDFTMRDVVLKKLDAPPPPGGIVGKIAFIPTPTNVTSTVIAAVNTATSAQILGSVNENSDFKVTNVPAGVYDLVVSLPGYSTALVHNVLVSTGTDVVLPSVVLQAGDGTNVCTPDETCTPSTSCRKGKIDCSTGTPICKEAGNAANGQLCGADKVCHDGACEACAAGGACVPVGAACHEGRYSCTSGTQVCVDTNTNRDNGVSCGANQVCNAGECQLCQQGATCTPTLNACHTGAIDCSSGSSVCNDTGGLLSNGSSCGNDKVCNGGVCVGCVAGGTCTPNTNACHVGSFTCNTGLQICLDSQESAPNGTACGQDLVCRDGSCLSCVTGAACVPTVLCHAGVTSCATGDSTCVDTQSPAVEGTPCGSGLVCHTGSCVPSGFTILSGNNQSATTTTLSGPITVQLNDQNGAPLVNATVTITAPSGGSSSPATTTTDLQGRVTFIGRLPRLAGQYTYTVASPNQGQITVSLTATDAADKTVFTLANLAHAQGNAGVPGPGVEAQVGQIRGVAVATDGTVYFADPTYHYVRKLSPSGQLTNFAGTGTYDYTGVKGDGGLATAAPINTPTSVALDEARQMVYIAETGHNVIRAVSLQSGIIATIAGGATIATAPYGDGLPAKAASLSNPNFIALGPDGQLYIADSNHGRIRRMNLTTNVLSTWVSSTTTCTNGVTSFAFYDCSSYYSAGCAMTWDGSGTAYLSGTFYGSEMGSCSATYGVARVNGDGSLAHVAGYTSGTTVEGRPAVASVLKSAPMLAADGAGNLYVSDYNDHAVRRIDVATGAITTWLGNRVAGNKGDFTTPAQAQLNSPWGIAFDSAGNFYLADGANATLRTVRKGGDTLPSSGSLTIVNGNGQAPPVLQTASQLLSVKLLDANGLALSGYAVQWISLDEGGSVVAPTSNTDNNGLATMQVRVGRATGPYRFQAIFKDVRGQQVTGSPVTFTATATAIPKGNIYTLVNLDRTGGYTVPPTPGPLARVNTPAGMALATDGTVYFTDSYYCMVKKLSKEGTLTTVAGTGSCAYNGDGGPAASAQLYTPTGIALDETNNLLYVAEANSKVVRQIDLTTQKISTYAGGGSIDSPTYGAGSPATSAKFLSPSHLSIGPDGALYVSDTSMDRIRRIDPQTKILTDWLKADGTYCNRVGFSTCSYNGTGACQLRWDSAGNAYLSATLIATVNGNCNTTPGIVRVTNAATNSFTLVAGKYLGATGDGRPATETLLSAAPYFDVDASGNVYLSNPSSHTIQRVDVTNGQLTTIAGNGSASFAGENTPAIGALLNKPSPLVVDSAGNLIFGEQGNDNLRAIAGGATSAGAGARLVVSAGDAQVVQVDQTLPQLFAAKLTDNANNPLVGYSVQWTVIDTGGGLYSTSSKTDVSGVATALGRPGLVPGSYRFQASYSDLAGNPVTGSPVTFTVTATAPASGTTFTVVNGDHSVGNTGFPGPGTMSRMNTPRGLALGANGDVYIADTGLHQVRKLTKEGIISLVAGSAAGTYGYSGDGGLAVNALMNSPTGLAYDALRNTLYIGDYGNNVIRAVSLNTGVITTIAGGGSAPGPAYGDSGPATAANLSLPTHVAVGPDDALYISEIGHDRIRKVPLSGATAGTITTWLDLNTSACSSSAVVFSSCDGSGAGSAGCSLTWDSLGNAYVSAALGGTAVNNGSNCATTPGIAMITPGGTVTAVVGKYNGSTAENVAANTALFVSAPVIALDASGNIIAVELTGHRIRLIDTMGKINTVAGKGIAGYFGDYVASTQAQLSSPWMPLIVSGGHVLFSDGGNACLREVW